MRLSPRPQAARRPCHRISCASSTHFQCSTGLSFSCSTVSSCCSPARSAGPPAGTKKSHSRAPKAHNPLESPGVLCFHRDLGQGPLPSVSSSVNEGPTSGALGDLEGRLPFALTSSLPAYPVLADLSAVHRPARPPSLPRASHPLRTLPCCQAHRQWGHPDHHVPASPLWMLTL